MNILAKQNSRFKVQGWSLLLVVVILFANPTGAFSQSKEMIQTMIKIAGRNGNYLLDMAPKPDGSVDDTQKKLFGEIGS
jgi:alpha-L-fucosidase